MLPYLLFYKIYKTIQSNNVYSTATLFHSHYFMQSPMKYNFISFYPPPPPQQRPSNFYKYHNVSESMDDLHYTKTL